MYKSQPKLCTSLTLPGPSHPPSPTPACLQVYPNTFLGEGSMYESRWWKYLVWAWEAAVYNPLLDLEAWGLPLAALALVAYLGRRWYLPAARGWAARQQLGGRLRLWWGQRVRGGGRAAHVKTAEDRDLNV